VYLRVSERREEGRGGREGRERREEEKGGGRSTSKTWTSSTVILASWRTCLAPFWASSNPQRLAKLMNIGLEINLTKREKGGKEEEGPEMPFVGSTKRGGQEGGKRDWREEQEDTFCWKHQKKRADRTPRPGRRSRWPSF
jgi:hypothetical protein